MFDLFFSQSEINCVYLKIDIDFAVNGNMVEGINQLVL